MLSLVKFKVVANETKNFFSSWNFGCRIASETFCYLEIWLPGCQLNFYVSRNFGCFVASETSYLEILIAKLPLKPAEFPREILAARFSLKFEICYLI